MLTVNTGENLKRISHWTIFFSLANTKLHSLSQLNTQFAYN